MVEKRRLYSLDVLKFLAAILIVFHHFHQCFGSGNMKILFYEGSVIYYGHLVEFFFILSGIFMAIKNDVNQNTAFGKFISKKIIRLMPVAALSVIVFSILSAIYFHITQSWWLDIIPTPWNIMKSCLLIFAGGGISDSGVMPNNPIWYLCVLLICYVWYWLILWLAKRLAVTPRFMFIAMIFLGMGIITYNITFPFLNSSAARGYIAFFTGVELVDLYKAALVKCKREICCVSFGVILLFVVLYVVNAEFFLTDGQGFLLTFLFFPALICVCVCSEVVRKIFSHRICGTLGAVSFEMYIWHLVIFMLMITLDAYGVIDFQSEYGTMSGTLLIIIIWGYIVYYLVERPLKEWLTKKMNV